MKNILGNIAMIVVLGVLALSVLNAILIFAGFFLRAITA